MFKNTAVFSNLQYVKSVLIETFNETESLSYYSFGKPCEGRQLQVPNYSQNFCLEYVMGSLGFIHGSSKTNYYNIINPEQKPDNYNTLN